MGYRQGEEQDEGEVKVRDGVGNAGHWSKGEWPLRITGVGVQVELYETTP